jgi:nanoRNase/pAp phosphatase (c-di-AMP/oligoRNAs hydrolase)
MSTEPSVALHEAAHAIAETMLVGDCEYVSIDPNANGEGRSGEMQGFGPQAGTPVVNMLAMLYAGQVAEVLFAGIDADTARFHARSDFAQADHILKLYNDTPQEEEAMKHAAMMLSLEVVHDAEEEIRQLADLLEKCERVEGIVVRQIIVESPRDLWARLLGNKHGFKSCSDYVTESIQKNKVKRP